MRNSWSHGLHKLIITDYHVIVLAEVGDVCTTVDVCTILHILPGMLHRISIFFKCNCQAIVYASRHPPRPSKLRSSELERWEHEGLKDGMPGGS